MTIYKYGPQNADIVLIQLVGDHDLAEVEDEVLEIRKRTSIEFQMIAVKVDSWNRDLSPWKAPAVFEMKILGMEQKKRCARY